MNYPNLEELTDQLESQNYRDRLLVGRVGNAHHVSGTFRGGATPVVGGADRRKIFHVSWVSLPSMLSYKYS